MSAAVASRAIGPDAPHMDGNASHEVASSLSQPAATGFAERIASGGHLSGSAAASPLPAGEAAMSSSPSAVPPALPGSLAAAATQAPPPSISPEVPTIAARPGRIGREMGIEIARRISAGGEELTVRLNPAEMGRIEVRLSFDERGSLRAVVAAESAAALDMLRRDHADLGRALADAGVRADAQSFRFDSRAGQNGAGQGEGGQFWQRQQQSGNQRRDADHDAFAVGDELEPIHRPLRASGRVNLMA